MEISDNYGTLQILIKLHREIKTEHKQQDYN